MRDVLTICQKAGLPGFVPGAVLGGAPNATPKKLWLFSINLSEFQATRMQTLMLQIALVLNL